MRLVSTVGRAGRAGSEIEKVALCSCATDTPEISLLRYLKRDLVCESLKNVKTRRKGSRT